ncbi:MAG: transcription antitermination factor NusB [Deltaproteobacteria bacterium]|nr:transcription antitermination factor NusB [Deltaproteobacteria bacterium]
MSTTRRSARICAVQILYPLSLGDSGVNTHFDPEQSIGLFWKHFEAPEDAKTYADRLVRGVSGTRDEIDRALAAASKHWRLDRMAKVDLTILRLATYEMLFELDVPHEVVIDEAVELTKQFSTAEAAAFVNGVLAPLVEERSLRRKG